MEKKCCEKCAYGGIGGTCTRDVKVNEFTGESSGLQYRNANRDGKCRSYAVEVIGQ